MTKAFDTIKAGLDDAIAFAQGDKTRGVEHLPYIYKTVPFKHQREIFEKTRNMEAYGILWEQGCGKSKPIIDTAAYLYERGKIDGVLIVAPGGVERNWITDELPAHMPDSVMVKTLTHIWQSKRASTKWHEAAINKLIKTEGLAWFCISYDAFVTKKGKKAVWRFLKRRRILMVLDESDDIKTPKAKRTRSLIAAGAYPAYKRILTGTPADKPFDIYSQLRFLDEGIWRRKGMARFGAFKQHYADWFTAEECRREKGFDPGYDKLLRFKNIKELAYILSTVSDRLLKDDVLDLPKKLYIKRYYEMTKKQQDYYEEMKEKYEIELEDGRLVDGNLALTRLLRLQQITCGYMVTDKDEPIEQCDVTNPRLDCTVDFLRKLNHPAIVWARFTHDIDQLMDALGDRAVRYDGKLNAEECEVSKQIFNSGDADWFVGNPAKGARGITLNAAKTVCYHSNSFKYRDRMQSEDRAHRIGQDGAEHVGIGFGVLYCDVIAENTVDTKIIDNLRDKFDIASQLTGDILKDWI